jgi:hypothetical protein
MKVTIRTTVFVAASNLGPNASPATFAVGGKTPTSVVLRRPTEEETASGLSPGVGILVATATFLLPGNLESVFKRIATTVGRLNADALGSGYVEWASHRESELSTACRGVFKLIRWRLGQQGFASPFGALPTMWSFDGQSWHVLPGKMRLIVGRPFVTISPNKNRAELQTMIDNQNAEPLAQELIREAIDLQWSNPRSCLLVAVAAAEVGVKQFIAGIVPATRWLLEETQSPPLSQILSSYLPELPAPYGPARIPRSIRKVIVDRAVPLRNKIAHSGTGTVTGLELEPILWAIEDLLWLLDYYRGYSWALEHVRPETIAELGLKAP